MNQHTNALQQTEVTAAARVRLLAVTCIALFMAMLDNLVLGVALPSIQQSFNANMSDLEWFMNAYTLTFAVLLIPFSSLGERIGRKKMFLSGVAVFTLGSVASALSDSSLQLALARALQGVGGAAIVPLSLTLVNLAFPPRLRAAAIGIWSGISGLGLSVGPLVGGLIVEGAPWQFIFWVNVPVGLAALLLGALWLRESAGARKSFDPLGIVLLGAGLFGLIFGLERGPSHGWDHATVWGPMALGVLLLVALIRWELGRKDPLIRLDLFRLRSYAAMIGTGFWLNAGIFGAIFLLTLFLQQAQGYTALQAGVREMTWTGMTMLCAPLAGMAAGRLGARPVLLTGFGLQTVALLGFALTVGSQGVTVPFANLVPFMMIAGAGMGLSFAPISHAVLSSVPEQAAGEASGMSNAFRELGGVFGIAISGTLFQRGGTIASAADFGRHLTPTLYACAAMLAIAMACTAITFVRNRAEIPAEPRGQMLNALSEVKEG